MARSTKKLAVISILILVIFMLVINWPNRLNADFYHH